MKIRFAVPLLVAALTFSVSACSSDSGGSASDTGSNSSANSSNSSPGNSLAGPSETPTMSQGEAEKELKERGFEIKKNEDGTTSVTRGEDAPQLNNNQLEMLTKKVECLRGKGYDMETPTAESPLVTPKGDFDQQKFNKDSMECSQQIAQSGS